LILKVFIIGASGEAVYGTSIVDDSPDEEHQIPAHVVACVTLFGSREIASQRRVYTLQELDHLWAYVMFDQFTLVFLTTTEEDQSTLKKRMLSLGKELVRIYGTLIPSWSGDMGQIEDLDDLVKQYVGLSLAHPEEDTMRAIESIVTDSLENHEIVYTGIFDTIGNEIAGTVPKQHLKIIQREISDGTVHSMDPMVPDIIKIQGYDVNILRVDYLAVAVATHKDAGRLIAIKTIDEIAHALKDKVLN
jgi:hypothetical protein